MGGSEGVLSRLTTTPSPASLAANAVHIRTIEPMPGMLVLYDAQIRRSVLVIASGWSTLWLRWST